MKRKFSLSKSIGKRNIMLAAVALVLVLMTTVTASISWIEEVSQVEFNSNNGQVTPLHIGNKMLKSDITVKANQTGTGTVNLGEYFNVSGDMHLSPCYGDGENFYFPVEGGGTANKPPYRIGTKDDANVNYLSATFRIKSEEASTVYWFEKTNSTTPFISFNKNGTNVNTTNLEQYLRVSITVDGATNVYAQNASGQYTTVITNAGIIPSTKTGRRVDQYSYYQEAFNDNSPEQYYKNSANVTDKPNQGAGENLNGNTLFTVSKYNSEDKTTVKTVTIKIWLEYAGTNSQKEVNFSSVNLNLVSSQAKTRRIYVKDSTVHQDGYSQARWLSTQNGQLFFALKDNLSTHWQLKNITGTDYYYADVDYNTAAIDDIPAIYNNTDVVLLRCEESWGAGTKSITDGTTTVNYWDMWETTFPDTYHSEVYTVYSTDFATWEDSSKVSSLYFINSQRFNNMSENENGRNFANVYDYMWDSQSVYNASDINGKVVKNANWPGTKMTTKMTTKMASGLSNPSIEVYAFFFNSDYDRIIFSDGHTETGKNYEFQTQDLTLSRSKNNWTFDMASISWFNTRPGESHWGQGSGKYLPYYSSDNTYVWGNFVTDNKWRAYRFAYGGQYVNTSDDAFSGTSSSNMLAKIYLKSGSSSDEFEFGLYINGNWWGAPSDSDKRVTAENNVNIGGTDIPKNHTIVQGGENLVLVRPTAKSVIRIYYKPDEDKIYLAKGE